MAYTPAGNLTTSAGLSHLQAVLYRKKGLDKLQKVFRFRQACNKETLQKASGRTIQFFRYTNLSANTTPTTEGTVGTSLSLTSRTVQATVSQFSSFITVSDLLESTAIDPVIISAADLLGYQAGLSLDTLTRKVIDAEQVGANQAVAATYFRVNDLRSARHSLQANDVRPFDSNEFLNFAHPYVTYDLVNDPNAAGLADVFKYTSVKDSPLVKYEDRGTVTHIAGCRVVETTNVNTSTSGANTLYWTYVFGADGIASVDLEGKGPSEVVDPGKQKFKINVIKGGHSLPDPEGLIGGMVSYNFCSTTVVLEGPPGIGGSYRFRILKPQSSIA